MAQDVQHCGLASGGNEDHMVGCFPLVMGKALLGIRRTGVVGVPEFAFNESRNNADRDFVL
jgi:hypothetical protein